MNDYKMKKMAGMCLAMTMLCSLTGCGGNEPSGDLMADYQASDLTIGGSATNETDGGQCLNENDTDISGGVENFFEDGAVALSDFGVCLMNQCYKSDENTLVSPLSVISALGMTANGAKGDTLSQMEACFRMEIPALNIFLKNYRESLPEGDNYKMNLANAIWFKDSADFTVNEAFLQTNVEYYDAGLYKAPFDTDTKDEINAWVNKNTDGMIKIILDEIPEEAVMYLVNALAFDGEWQKIYTENRVREGEFTTEEDTKQSVTMMYSEENTYLEDEKAQGFLKYYADKKYAFVGLLPKEGVTVEEYINTLDGETLQNLLDNLVTVQVNAGIPKFEQEYDVEMSDLLQALGMVDVFDEQKADLSNLGSSLDGNLFVNRVLHKTFIAVDERGTKAGAATVVEVTKESMAIEPPEIKTVILNRPFVYMIIDCESQVPMFIGTVMNMQ